MSLIIPVPLLSLCSGKILETYVCGAEHLDVAVLKKIVRSVTVSIYHQAISPCGLGIAIFLLMIN